MLASKPRQFTFEVQCEASLADEARKPQERVTKLENANRAKKD